MIIFLFPLALAAAIIISVKRPEDSLKILAVVIPFQAFGAMEAGFTIPPAYWVLLLILVGILARGEFFALQRLGAKAAAVFLGVALIATIVANGAPSLPELELSRSMHLRAGPWRSPVQLALIFFHFSIFFVVVRFIRNQSSADSILKIHLTMGLLLAGLGIYQIFAFTLGLPLTDCTWSMNVLNDSATIKYSSIRLYSARVAEFSTRATFPESRDFADYLLSTVPIMTAFAVSGSPDIRRRFGLAASPAAALIGLAAIFFTMSRSGWIFIAVALIIIASRLSRRLLFVHLPIGLIVLSGVSVLLIKAGFFTSSADSLWDIVSGRFQWYYVVNDPRFAYLLVLWESFTSHPILGLGAGNFALWGAMYTGSDLLHSAHGFAWATLADFGLLGLAALLSVFAVIFKKLHRAIKAAAPRSEEHILLVGIFTSLLVTFLNSMTGGDRPQFYLLLLLGLAAVYAMLPAKTAQIENINS